MCASFALWQQAATEITRRDHSCCLFAPCIYIVVLRAHPVRGESHNQRNASGEVATTSLPFCNEPHDPTFFLWRLHLARPSHPGHSTILLRSEKPERHVRKASHCGSKQQQRSYAAITLIACSRHAYILLFFAHIPFVVNHTINATPAERLQHCQMDKNALRWNETLIVVFSFYTNNAGLLHVWCIS